MKKSTSDPKVKKTLVRNCEQKIRPTSNSKVCRDFDVRSPLKSVGRFSRSSQKENELNEPALCSSELLADYLIQVKESLPPPLSAEDLNVNKNKHSTKVTKKLNFHLNDRMYKNLIELNGCTEDLKSSKLKRPSSTIIKRDLEPNIEDFYEDETEEDLPPNIPIIKPKLRPVQRVETGQLHKLLASFESL